MSFDAGQFRAEVRAFCREHFPAELARKAAAYVHFSKADRVRWQRLLDERGWFTGHWPVEFGGQGWGPLQRFIFIEELEYAGTPWLTHFGVKGEAIEAARPQALVWALERGSRSGRVAYQFARDYAGRREP